jgi:hypothetical protein
MATLRVVIRAGVFWNGSAREPNCIKSPNIHGSISLRNESAPAVLDSEPMSVLRRFAPKRRLLSCLRRIAVLLGVLSAPRRAAWALPNRPQRAAASRHVVGLRPGAIEDGFAQEKAQVVHVDGLDQVRVEAGLL